MAASNSPVIRGRAGTYVVCQGIGKGAYGEVFLVKSKKDRKMVSTVLVKLTALAPAHVFSRPNSIGVQCCNEDRDGRDDVVRCMLDVSKYLPCYYLTAVCVQWRLVANGPRVTNVYLRDSNKRHIRTRCRSIALACRYAFMCTQTCFQH